MSGDDSMEGFYVAYLTGAAGSSMAIFTFLRGVVVGADAGGMTYEGTYEVDEAASQVIGSLSYRVPAGVSLITGFQAPEGSEIKMPFSIATSFADGDIVRIDTPAGPVNAKFQKIRGGEGL